MLSKLCDKIVLNLYQGGFIKRDDIEIYRFGVEAALIKSIHYLSILFVGIMFNMVVQTIFFVANFCFLREFAGGYHAKTRVHCFAISLFMITLALLIAKMNSIKSMYEVSIFTFILSFLIIFYMSPVENISKPLDYSEIKRYKKISRIILLIESTISIFIINIYFQYFLIVTIAFVYVSCLLIMGKIEAIRREN